MASFKVGDKVLVDYITANRIETVYEGTVVEVVGDPPTAYRVDMVNWLSNCEMPVDRVRPR